jgi:hypothetical protein
MSRASNLGAALSQFDRAVDAGLRAMAETYATAVKRQLARGYTTGAFVTGRLLNSITIQGPVSEGGVRTMHVGTPVDYAMYWELGHQNLFTGRFERVPIWLPTLLATLTQQRAAFEAGFTSVMQGGVTAEGFTPSIRFGLGPGEGA